MQTEREERVMMKVWDWETRVLHWINATLIICLVLLMLGYEGMEIMGVEKALRTPVKRIHAYVGHIFVVTFILRILWGFLGNKYARFSDIIPFKGEKRRAMAANVKWYLSGFRGSPARVPGHDPLASLFYIALFIVLVTQALSGVLLAGMEFDMFPGYLLVVGLGEAAIEGLEEVAEGFHAFGFYFMLFFIAAHILGLVVHEVKEKTGLFSSMIHGNKYLTKER